MPFTLWLYRAAVPLYVVRHAKAGSRHEFEGDDVDRPLTSAGRKQAEALSSRLASVSPALVVSSPYRRCVETVQPLAVALALDVTLDDRLAEFDDARSKPDAEFFDFLHSLPDNTVACSHGDVIPAVVRSLRGAGMRIEGDAQWGKGSVWVLQRVDNRFVSAAAWPPPEVD